LQRSESRSLRRSRGWSKPTGPSPRSGEHDWSDFAVNFWVELGGLLCSMESDCSRKCSPWGLFWVVDEQLILWASVWSNGAGHLFGAYPVW
jgi:hypothetical protein